jgi:predicted TIM-barrel fold metal-dependent hydrolase
MDPEFRDRAPRLFRQGNQDVFVVEGLPPSHVGVQATAGKRSEELKWEGKFEEGRRGGWDPEARVKDMDVDRVDAEVLYPTLCFGMWRVPDTTYQYACMRAYNDWLADFANMAPGRLVANALISLRDVDAGIRELRRVAAKGTKAACITAVAPDDRPYSHPDYDRFWATAQELNIPLSLHVFTGSKMELDTTEFLVNYALVPRWIQGTVGTMIVSGVMERFPSLKVISVEVDIGWIATFLHRLDHAFERHRHWSGSGASLKMRPSEYFHRQVYATFMDDLAGIKLRHEVGVDNIMWSSDYPHPDSTWPRSQQVIGKLFKDVPAQETHKIIHDNAARLYNLA